MRLDIWFQSWWESIQQLFVDEKWQNGDRVALGSWFVFIYNSLKHVFDQDNALSANSFVLKCRPVTWSKFWDILFAGV